jgi:uncharacterized protein YcnI
MRCSGWSSLAISACRGEACLAFALTTVVFALVFASDADAHVVATPTFLATGSSESITFAAPNERDAPMTGFSIAVPPGIVIEHAHEIAGWSESVDGTVATWTGGSVEPEAETSFGATLGAEAEPGLVEVIARQQYDDGGVVRWSVPLAINPAAESPSQNLALAGVVGLIGVLCVLAVVLLAWRRRST